MVSAHSASDFGSFPRWPWLLPVLPPLQDVTSLRDYYDANLALESHRLVSLRFISLETRRDNNGRFARASLRFRALTEPN